MSAEARLAALYVYPVKSCRGFAVEAWTVEERGLAHDRRWMWVGPQGRALTQRELPKMALISVALTEEALQLAYPGREPLWVPLEPGQRARWCIVRLWNEELRLLDLGPEPARWFASALGQEARLVFQPRESHRPLDARYGRPGEGVSLADGYPILLLSEASLEALNALLERPVSVLRFRPNLVFAGVEPFVEDTWSWVRLGSVRLRLVKPCSRCLVPSIDPESGCLEPEPLRTLASFRLRQGRIWLGQNAVPETTGPVWAGQRAELGLR
ncbi:MAG: MOSC N-terminal beta barrel domain-containing protein [Rhodothermia bacterium]|nr:MOSC N-terminal beta barrel domain-containing protein [Rhodothermia bacterium]